MLPVAATAAGGESPAVTGLAAAHPTSESATTSERAVSMAATDVLDRGFSWTGQKRSIAGAVGTRGPRPILPPEPDPKAGGSMSGRLEEALNLGVEIPRDLESSLVPVGSEEARHGVVGEVHAIRALVDEDRDRCVRGSIGNL